MKNFNTTFTVIPRRALGKTKLTLNRSIVHFNIWDDFQCDGGKVAAPSNGATFCKTNNLSCSMRVTDVY